MDGQFMMRMVTLMRVMATPPQRSNHEHTGGTREREGPEGGEGWVGRVECRVGVGVRVAMPGGRGATSKERTVVFSVELGPRRLAVHGTFSRYVEQLTVGGLHSYAFQVDVG